MRIERHELDRWGRGRLLCGWGLFVLLAGLIACGPDSARPEATASDASGNAVRTEAVAAVPPAAQPASRSGLRSASRSASRPARGSERSDPIPPRFETLTVADGLASIEANVFLQDRQGFLWIGTFGGLSRFDGAGFTNFVHDPADSTSLVQNKVNSLFEDRSGAVWVGTNGGLDRFDPLTETFTHYRHDPADSSSLGHDVVRAVVEGAGGAIWAGTRGDGLHRLDPARETWTRISRTIRDPHLGEEEVHALLANEDGTLWVGGSDGLALYDPSDDTFAPVRRVFGDSTAALLPIVYSLCRDRHGSVWAGTRTDGLFRYNATAQTVVHYPPDPADPTAIGNPWVLSMVEDRDGTLWIGTNGAGLHRYDRAADAFTRFTYDPSNPESLRDNVVLSVGESRDGVLWVGTYGGLARRYPLSQYVARVRPGTGSRLLANTVTAFAEDASGALWVGTDGRGLHRRTGTGSFTRVEYDAERPYSRAATDILSLAIDGDGALWVGAIGGLYRRDPATQTFARVADPMPSSAPDDADLGGAMMSFIYDLDVAGDRVLAAAGVGGVVDVETDGRAVVRTRITGTPEAVTAVLHDRTGQTWAGTYNVGLWRLVARSGTPPALQRVPLTLSSQQVNTLYEDREGGIWIGTGDGLDRLVVDETGATLTHFHRADGLPNTFIRGLVEDRDDRLWVATSTGLSWRDVQTGSFLSYDARDGIETGGPLYVSPNTGQIYVGGNHGYMVFDPAMLPAEPPPPAPVLTGLQMLGVPVRIGVEDSPLRRALSVTDELRLRHDDRVVTFAFASLDFRAPGKHRYAVRLDGFDDDWRDLGAQRQATFTNLSPGAYTLRVRTAGRDGVWGEATTLAVTVAPPWWQTGWAYLAYTLFVLGLGTTVYRDWHRRRSLRRRMEVERIEANKLRELDHARSRFFANVSHEFRTPLTLTLGPLNDLIAGLYGPLDPATTQQVDLARRNARRVLDLINQMLDVARLEAGRTPLRAQPVNLGAFVESVAQPFQDLAERKAVTFDVGVPAASTEVFADPPQLEKVVANLLANAIKFTPTGGTVRVTMTTEAGAAHVSVRDSGPGISAEELPRVFDRFYQVGSSAQMQLGTGIGLALAKEIMDLHGGTLVVESEEGFGSTFTFTLPLGRSHLTPAQIDDDGEAWTPASPDPVPPAPAANPPAPAPQHPEGEATGREETRREETGGEETGSEPAHAEQGEEDAAADVTTVLVVEDHADIRAYVRRHLESAPVGHPTYRVLEAADGEAGLALARAHLPDLILSDVMMPKLDGLRLCRALKTDPETNFIPVILLTAKAAPEDRLDGLREYADDYLTKPFDVQELRIRIDNLITSRQRLRNRVQAAAPQVHASAIDTVSSDEAFLERVRQVVEDRLEDEYFNVEEFAEAMDLSRVHLYRRLRELIGQSPSTLIRTMRLERAAQLVAQEAASVSEIAYGVGFKSVSHFSRSFREHYGSTPTEYAARMAGAEAQADGRSGSGDA